MAIRNIENQRIDVADATGYISVSVKESTGGGLTDAELRATPVPVSGDVNATITEGQVSDGGSPSGLNPVFIAGIDRGSSAIYTMAVDTDGNPQVDVLTLPPVTATNLDIRDLTFATDKVDASGSTGVGVTGTFWQATQPVSLTSTTITGSVAVTQSGTWDEVGINDSGNSITVDAPVATPVFVRLSDGASAIATLPVSAASLPLPSGAATSALQTQPGVDIGDVTINNASGGSAVNIQDGGNSITVDGTVTANLSGSISNTGFVRSPYSTIADGRKTVTTAGTRVTLASTTACKEVTITALDTNTDVVVIGGTTVVASAGTRTGTPLLPSQAVTLNVDDLNKINLDSVVSGEGVSYTYHT